MRRKCGIGAITGSTFWLMPDFGAPGWVPRKVAVPPVPVILGILPGDEMEVNLRRAMIVSGGDRTALFDSRPALLLRAIAIIGFVLPIWWASA